MKRILFPLPFLYPALSYAQLSSADVTEPSSKTDEQVFELLDDAEIPTRLLWDKAAKFDDPALFDGTTLNGNNASRSPASAVVSGAAGCLKRKPFPFVRGRFLLRNSWHLFSPALFIRLKNL